MSCAVCGQRPAVLGVLCELCASRLKSPAALAPEQIVAHDMRDANAALVDVWGRPHRIDPSIQIGRAPDGPTLCVIEPTVSRHHASLAREGNRWIVRDLGSANGTFIDDVPVQRRTVVPDHARLAFGRVRFYLLATAPITASRVRTASETVRHSSETTIRIPKHEPDVTFMLREPTGGGGALATIDGKIVQLTVAQLELVRALIERRLSDPDGYVSTEELLAHVSLESSSAETDSVRHLVARVRKLFAKAGIPEIIESRPKRGYRLNVMPILK